MNIKRMLLIASMALVAVAFAAPATAGAVVRLTAPAGTPLAVGAAVTATSTNLITTSLFGTFECEKVTLHYILVTNGKNHVVLNPIAAQNATFQNCLLNTVMGKFLTHVTNAGFGQITLNTWGTGTAATTFTSNITSLAHCSFHGSIPIQATNGTDLAHIETPNTLTGTETNCPLQTEIHGSVTLESNGVAVISDFVPTG